MGLDFGVLGRVATAGAGGYLKGRNLAEQLRAEREIEEAERKRKAEEQALRMLILQQEQEQNQHEVGQRPVTEQRAQEEHQSKMRERSGELYGTMFGKPESQEEQLERQSRIEENEAQRDYYKARTHGVRHPEPKTPKGPTETQQRNAWQKDLDAIASAAGGDLGKMHMMINQDERLFALRGDRTIRDYHVAAAASRAKRATESGSPGEGDDNGLPAHHRKFPSESAEAYVRRLKRMGVDSATVMRYGQLQGL